MNPQTGKPFTSGTEEEFVTAYDLWKQYGKPRIMMYRCTRPFPFDVDPDQLKQVNDFFKSIQDPKSDHRLLSQNFDTTESFEKLLSDNLQKILIEYGEHSKTPITPEVAEILAPKIPNNLPRRVSFFGRKDEIVEAMRALSPEDRGWGVVIDGIGGIGKTALAIEVAYLCKEKGKFDGFVFVSAKLDQLEPSGIQETTLATTTLDAFLNECARAIGRQGIAQLSSRDKQRVFLDALRGMRTLLIFDNLETLTTQEQAAIGEFLRELPAECKAIVTSRRRTGESAVTIRLERLDWETARELIENEMARHPDVKRALSRAGEAGWKQLNDEAGGSPLALTWTIGLIRAQGLSFERALALLRDGSTASDLNAFIYNEALKRMDLNERAALGALSFFAGPATFEALSATASLDRRALDVVLERLRALSLVDLVESAEGEERYGLHPLTKRFARADLEEDAQSAHETGMRFARYWLDYARQYGGSSRNYETFDRLEAEWTNLDAAANWLWEIARVQDDKVSDKDAARMLNDLVNELRNFMWFGGRWDERVQLNARAYEAMRALNDWSEAGWRACDVAWIYGFYCRSISEEASVWVERLAEAWGREGNKREQATVIRMQGLVAWQRHEYLNADRLLEEALSLARVLAEERDIAISLEDLGELEIELGEYNKSNQYFSEALKLLEKLRDKAEEAECIDGLGRLELLRQRWLEAREWFERALMLSKVVRSVQLRARAQYGLACVEEAEGHADLALPLAQEALKIYGRLQYKDLVKARELVERLKKAISE
jgi:tetratricopeptide (TPR) repeat protein